MLTDKDVAPFLGALTALRFFPTNRDALRSIAEILKQSKSVEHMKCVVKDFLAKHNEWIGPARLNAAVLGVEDPTIRPGIDRPLTVREQMERSL